MPGRRLASQIETSLAFVHRVNIERYKKLLGTDLTSDERAFILNRITEEESALRRMGVEV
jgi:hypothetical protein